MYKTRILATLAVLLFSNACLAASSSADGAKIYLIAPADGATVSSPVTVLFGLRGMGVAPAGVDQVNTGHHHLFINVDTLPPLDQPLPKDAQHRHFGGGQTETSLDLPPGKHTLQLMLGDHQHMPHSPALISEKITITVTPSDSK